MITFEFFALDAFSAATRKSTAPENAIVTEV
jgi:hypothetical protein